MRAVTSFFLLIYVIGRDCVKFNLKMSKSVHKIFLNRSRMSGLNKYEGHMKRTIKRNEVI